MQENFILESLSPIERKVLPLLSSKETLVDNLKIKDLDKTSIIRGIGFLSNKKLVETHSKDKVVINLGILGVNYVKKQLPERVLLNKIHEKKSVFIGDLKNVCNLNDNEIKVALGILKKKKIIDIISGQVKLSVNSSDYFAKKFPEEIFLQSLPRELNDLKAYEKTVLQDLKDRKELVEIKTSKEISVKLTDLGLKISKMDLKLDFIEQLTPKMLKMNNWKGKKFRRYDLSSPAPKVYGGKRHFVNQAKDYAKAIWLEMGFKEMTGNMVETGFWVFDTLFTAQDHPVREMQDTFYLKNIKGKLPDKNKSKVSNVVAQTMAAHKGGLDNSKGWQYDLNEEESKRVLLRTHTTAISAKKLMEIGQTKEYPAKYFAIGKCFRNETIDWSHNFEFNQTEGIVIDENANFRQLLGYLMQFYKKMGYEKVRIRPAYFAYTEPSLEIDAFHPVHKKWVELGGAGMFRPEVTIPMFGKHIPVLAWGPGFDRIIMEYFEINDLRDMYKNDLTKLREMKFWGK